MKKFKNIKTTIVGILTIALTFLVTNGILDTETSNTLVSITGGIIDSIATLIPLFSGVYLIFFSSDPKKENSTPKNDEE